MVDTTIPKLLAGSALFYAALTITLCPCKKLAGCHWKSFAISVAFALTVILVYNTFIAN